MMKKPSLFFTSNLYLDFGILVALLTTSFVFGFWFAIYYYTSNCP